MRTEPFPPSVGGGERIRLRFWTKLLPRWHELVTTYAAAEVPYPKLRLITLAQWAIESNWAISGLAVRHNNFGGIKYRPRMAGFAKPVRFNTVTDGRETYCEFTNISAFIRGYWHFIETGPYVGWEAFGNDPVGFIRHLKNHGYAEDGAYVERVCRLYEGFCEDIRRYPEGISKAPWE